jgi:predicted hotdog family 3-hydroxylacyl-ACP dehydratase
MPLAIYPIEDVLPHRPPMILIDEIVAREADAMVARVTVVRTDFFFEARRGLGTHIALEWMAQTCGAFAGSQARDRSDPVRIGYLLGTRDFQARRQWFKEGERLSVIARLQYQDEAFANFACEVRDATDGQALVTATLNVFYPDDSSTAGTSGAAL